MYISYYGFTTTPFDLTPDPDVVYMSESHQEALAVLRYGVVGKKGYLVLTGDVGTGKTTLLETLLHSLDEDIHLCLVSNPTLTRDEFFSLLARQFGLPWDHNKAFFLLDFAEFLKRCHAKDERVLLIIDEAHALNIELLEEIRLLSNQDAGRQDILSIFLVGQPELNELMGSERLLPLRQRIGIRFHLKRFSREETSQYILFRLRKAGGRHLNIFTENAISLIYRVSKGTPRLINIVCDHALLTGFAKGKPLIDENIIRECVKELQFPGEVNPLPLSSEITAAGRRFHLGRILLFLACLLAVLLVVEVLPVTRPFSPLGLLLPQGWLLKLHQLVGMPGG
jgi:general secretion pathway protein A